MKAKYCIYILSALILLVQLPETYGQGEPDMPEPKMSRKTKKKIKQGEEAVEMSEEEYEEARQAKIKRHNEMQTKDVRKRMKETKKKAAKRKKKKKTPLKKRMKDWLKFRFKHGKHMN